MNDSGTRTQSVTSWAEPTAILSSAGFAGGTLLIGLIGATRWQNMDPLVWMTGFWGEFTGFALGIMPLYTLSFVGLIFSFRNPHNTPRQKKWWKTALAMWLANTLITSFYHVPENLRLREMTYSANEAAAALDMWMLLHWPRLVLAWGVAYAATKAVLPSGRQAPE